MKTSEGDIKIELDREKAPKTVENFLAYAKAGHYDGTIFHRVIDGFMVQGGGFDENMNQKPAPNTVENEADNGLKNDAGTIAMARTQVIDSATAQFFINLKDNDFLSVTWAFGSCLCMSVCKPAAGSHKIKLFPSSFKDFPLQHCPGEMRNLTSFHFSKKSERKTVLGL